MKQLKVNKLKKKRVSIDRNQKQVKKIMKNLDVCRYIDMSTSLMYSFIPQYIAIICIYRYRERNLFDPDFDSSRPYVWGGLNPQKRKPRRGSRYIFVCQNLRFPQGGSESLKGVGVSFFW